MGKFKALVAVRSGSQRVINKNIREFCGSNLLEIKLQQLIRVNLFDGIVVNSNDEAILNVASKYNVELVKRDLIYAQSDSPMSEVYANMAMNMDCETIAYTNVTNPLLQDDSLTKMVEFYFNNKENVDSVNSSHSIKEFLFRENRPINYDLMNMPRSQDLPNIQALNFAVNILSKNDMIQGKNVVGKNPFLFELNEIESVDIDTQLDFDIAEILFKKFK